MKASYCPPFASTLWHSSMMMLSKRRNASMWRTALPIVANVMRAMSFRLNDAEYIATSSTP